MQELKEFSDLPDDLSDSADSSDRFTDFRSQTDDYVREHPDKAVGFALLGGFVLSQLPIGFILVLLFRAVLLAAKPALLILGGMKLVEEVQKRCD